MMLDKQNLKHSIVDQNSEEWFQLRAGLVTASQFSKVMANFGKPFGDPALRLAEKIAVERVRGIYIPEQYTNSYMERGHEFEPYAREAYEMVTFHNVMDGGFYSNGNYGYSPDGDVGNDGHIEIKSVILSTQFRRLKKGGYDTAYHWQMMGGLWLTGRKWCDFISYCPEMPEHKQLYLFRVEPSQSDFKKIESRMEEFEATIKENIDLLK